MHLPKPAFQHPPEVHEAIIREHQGDPVQMAYRLQSFGWRKRHGQRSIGI